MKKQKGKRTRIILSILALVEVIALIAGITFSWVEGGKKSYVNGNDIQVSTGSGVTMFKDGKNTNSISLSACELAETSSSDGRNFFFPMADTESNVTSEMTFREGTASDRNKKYVSVDFQLVAGSSDANVYLGAGTIIQCGNKDLLSALRMSFSKNDGTAPIVFKPNQMPGVDNINFSPITAIKNDGKVETTTVTETKAYGDYYYNGSGSQTLFSLSAGETKNITLSIWLEGTEFSGNDVAEKPLSIYIDFTTQHDDLVKYNFVDNTHGFGSENKDPEVEHWITEKPVEGDYATMMYIYDDDTKRYYTMKQSSNYKDGDYTWTAYVPASVRNFVFRRYSIDIDKYWNEWVPSMTDIPEIATNEHTYVAICGVKNYNKNDNWEKQITQCGGYWKESSGKFRVFFENSDSWDKTIRCYAWGNGNSEPLGAFPGTEMTKSHTNDKSHDIWYIDLKESDNITAILFTNKQSRNDSGSQTEDIEKNESEKFDFFNGFTAWYDSKSTTANKQGYYIQQSSVNNPLWDTITIYADASSIKYSSYYLYAYTNDSDQSLLLGSWPGKKMTYDSESKMYKMKFDCTKDIKVIVNNNAGEQIEHSDSCQPGKAYKITSSGIEEYVPYS